MPLGTLDIAQYIYFKEAHVPVPVKFPGCTHWLQASAKEAATAKVMSCEHRILNDMFTNRFQYSIVLHTFRSFSVSIGGHIYIYSLLCAVDTYRATYSSRQVA
jgi:hypothetical protein